MGHVLFIYLSILRHLGCCPSHILAFLWVLNKYCIKIVFIRLELLGASLNFLPAKCLTGLTLTVALLRTQWPWEGRSATRTQFSEMRYLRLRKVRYFTFQLLARFGPWLCCVTGWWLPFSEPQFLYCWGDHVPLCSEVRTRQWFGA